MKKIKLIISAICVSLAIIICAVMVHLSNKNFVEDVFIGNDIEHGVDEYLLSQGYVKFPEKEKGVWLVENTDTDFDRDSEKLNKALTALEKSFFDTVFLRSEYFSAVNEELTLADNIAKNKKVNINDYLIENVPFNWEDVYTIKLSGRQDSMPELKVMKLVEKGNYPKHNAK